MCRLASTSQTVVPLFFILIRQRPPANALASAVVFSCDLKLSPMTLTHGHDLAKMN